MKVSHIIFAILFSVPSHSLDFDTSLSLNHLSTSLANNGKKEDSDPNHSRPSVRRQIADQTRHLNAAMADGSGNSSGNDGKRRHLATKLLDADTRAKRVGARQSQGHDQRKSSRKLYFPTLDDGTTEVVNIRPFVMVIGPTTSQLYQGTIDQIRNVVQEFLLDKLRNSPDPQLALTVDVTLAGESFSWKPAGGSAALPGPLQPAHAVIRFDGGVAETTFSLDYAKPLMHRMKTGILNIIDSSSSELLSQLLNIDGLSDLTFVLSQPELPVTSSPNANPSPTARPTASPTKNPTASPTKAPTELPTKNPTVSPTKAPTSSPMRTLPSPTKKPTKVPTKSPSTSTTTATIPPSQRPTESSQENFIPVLTESEADNGGNNDKVVPAVAATLSLGFILSALLLVRKKKYGRYLKSANPAAGGSKMNMDDEESDVTGSPDSKEEHRKVIGNGNGSGNIASQDAQQAYDTSTIPNQSKKRSLRNMFPIVASPSKKPQDIFLADPSRRRDERRELAAISELESGYGYAGAYADDFSADPFLEISGSSASIVTGASACSPFSREEDESFGMSTSIESSIQKEVMSSGSDTISPSVAYDDPSSRRDYQGVLKPTNVSAKSFVSTLSSESSRGTSTRNEEDFLSDGETDASESATSRRSRNRISSRNVRPRPAFRSLSTTRTENEGSFKLDKSWDPDDADPSKDDDPCLDCQFQYTKAQTKPLTPAEKKSFA